MTRAEFDIVEKIIQASWARDDSLIVRFLAELKKEIFKQGGLQDNPKERLHPERSLK